MNTQAKNNHEVKEFIPRTFTDIIDNFFNETIGASSVSFMPRVDVSETEKSYEINLALPDVKKEEIKIDFHDGKLTISGDRKLEKAPEGKKFHTLETQYGSFKRSFQLPEKVNYEAIEAEYVDGILKINIPKDERKIAKATIQIK